jgi:hypothetical protein
VVDNIGTGVSSGFDGVLLRFERFDGVEVKGNRQLVGKNVTPIALVNSCNVDIDGNDFGPAAPAPATLGDCSAPGLAPATSSTTGRIRGTAGQPTEVERRAEARRRRAESRRRAAERKATRRRAADRPERAAAPTDDDDSAVPIVLALLAGVGAGVAGTVVVQRVRRHRASASPTGGSESRDEGGTDPD